jgi:hypothetical protein
MSVGLDINSVGLARAVRKLRKMSDFSIDDLLDNIGSVVESQVRRRITNQEGPPEGGDWDEYTPEYERWKARK